MKKSRNGCFNCKIRKKKCDESKPVCSDCSRLEKKCVYPTDNMKSEEFQRLKKMVGMQELQDKKNRLIRIYDPSSVSKKRKKCSSKPTMTSEAPVKTQSAVVNELASAKTDVQNETAQAEKEQNQSGQIVRAAPRDQVQLQRRTPSPLTRSSQTLQAFGEMANEFSIQFNTSQVFESIDFENRPMSPETTYKEFMSYSNQFSFNIDSFIPHSPSPTPSSTSPSAKMYRSLTNDMQLDETETCLYNYYKENLGKKICIIPMKYNFYLNFFLPLVHFDKGVRYGIFAWSGYHLGIKDPKFSEIAESYVKKALNNLSDNFLIRLATYLILCGADICSGDVRRWTNFLKKGFEIIEKNGGFLNLINRHVDSNEGLISLEDQKWLATNFAYHDILASSARTRGTYFPVSYYYDIKFSNLNDITNSNFETLGGNSITSSKLVIDPLNGCCQPLFNLIGEINGLSIEVKELMEDSTASDSSYESVRTSVEHLRRKIDDITINSYELSFLGSDKEIELQVQLFNLLKLTLLLHFKSAIDHCIPKNFDVQYTLRKSMAILDRLVGSSVQASLCFPMFMCGINCVSKKDRMETLRRFEVISSEYEYKSFENVKVVIEKIWKMNNDGSKFIEWYSVVQEMGWDLSFA